MGVARERRARLAPLAALGEPLPVAGACRPRDALTRVPLLLPSRRALHENCEDRV